MDSYDRVFCQECGDALRMWDDVALPYERWLESPCANCGTRPTESRYQDSEIFLASPMAGPLGAVALTFETLANALRVSITMLCFNGAEANTDVSDAMLAPLSYSEQVRVFSAVCLARFPEREADVRRLRNRLDRSGEARNRVLHSWWLPGKSFFESGTRIGTRISGGKLKKDHEDVSVKELTHLASYFNKLQSDLLTFALTVTGRLALMQTAARPTAP